MYRSHIPSLVFIIALIFMVSCSGGYGDVIARNQTPAWGQDVITEASGATTCFGLWQIVLDLATGTGDIVQPTHIPDGISFPATITGIGFIDGTGFDDHLEKAGGPGRVPTVKDINPASHDIDNIPFPAMIKGAKFEGGVSLGVKLMRTGQSDILATGEVVTSPTMITCWLQLPDDPALIGLWDVQVTNGLGGVGTGTGIFTATCSTPTVTSINPASRGADNVSFPAIIIGTGFIDGTGFDVHLEKTGETDIVPTNVVVVDTTTITCDITIPIGTMLGFWDIEVTNSCGLTGLGAGVFEVVCPRPTVTSINPASRDIDNIPFTATITGTNFVAGASLDVRLMRGTFAIDATDEVVTSPTTISCTLQLPDDPALISLWDVQVTNGCGGVGTGSRIFWVTCPMPNVTGINPAWHSIDNVPFTATITGTNFVAGASLGVSLKRGILAINATDEVVTSPTTITCTFQLPSIPAFIGLWDIQVTNGLGGVGIGTGIFTATCPAVTVTSINPAWHRIDNIPFRATIRGTNFIAGASLDVRLRRTGQSDILATDVDVMSPTMITCRLRLPSTMYESVWDVRVTNGCGGVGTGTGIFTAACPAPTVTSISSNSVCSNGASVLYIIYGTGFISSSSLDARLQRSGQSDIVGTFITYFSRTHVRFRFAIPPGTSPGLWNVRVMNGCGSYGIGSNLFTVVAPASPVGNLNLTVRRCFNHSIFSSDNIRMFWSPASGAVQYAIYCDTTPYSGITPTTYVGVTSTTWCYDICPVDGARVYVVRSRAIAGDAGSESADSEWAFVDFEQAEDTNAEGSWKGNNQGEYAMMNVTRSGNEKYRLSGSSGWHNVWAGSYNCRNKWNVFYSDSIPEIPSASTFRLEVPWKLFCQSRPHWEDGLSFGYLSSIPEGGSSDTRCYEYRLQLPITGAWYSSSVNGLYDEFDYPTYRGHGYRGSYTSWQYTVVDVSGINSDIYDWVSISHAMSTYSLYRSYCCFDDIAIVIY